MKIWNVKIRTAEGDLETGEYCGIAESPFQAVELAVQKAHEDNADAVKELVDLGELTKEEAKEQIIGQVYASEITMVSEIDF